MFSDADWSQGTVEWGVSGGSILGGTNGGRGQEVCGSARRGGGPRTRLRRSRYQSECLAEVQTSDDAAFPARGNVAHWDP